MRKTYFIVWDKNCILSRKSIRCWLQEKCDLHGPLTRYVNYVLRMHRECWGRFPRHWSQRKRFRHASWHVPWCMSVSLTCGGGESVPGIPGACATLNFKYLVRGPCIIVILKLWRCRRNAFLNFQLNFSSLEPLPVHLNGLMQYLQCFSNEDAVVLH